MLLVSFYSNYQKAFELFLAGDTRKYKKYSVFVKNADVTENSEGKIFFLEFSKLHKVLSICAKFQVSGILPSETK